MRKAIKIIGVFLAVGVISSVLFGSFSAGAIERTDKQIIKDYGFTQDEVDSMDKNFISYAAGLLRSDPSSVTSISPNAVTYTNTGYNHIFTLSVFVGSYGSVDFEMDLTATNGYLESGKAFRFKATKALVNLYFGDMYYTRQDGVRISLYALSDEPYTVLDEMSMWSYDFTLMSYESLHIEGEALNDGSWYTVIGYQYNDSYKDWTFYPYSEN
ncbi:MAG TPA: hypothetical protein H9675_00120 [Firmicutes bacterium]|nr:hypothetical protein [Bacillota bacterium]